MSIVQLHKEMGPLILTHLRQFGDLPEIGEGSGIIAGQAVTSAISELFGDGRYNVYNDVDYFNNNKYTGEKKSGVQKELRTVNFRTEEIEEDYNGMTIVSADRYTVLSSSRDGMINNVRCLFGEYEPTGFLKTFDFNCVQAGVDMKTGNLHWTNSFNQFMKTGQLEIENVHTPFHTAIRWFKKMNELPLYGDTDRAMELVSLVSAMREKACQENPWMRGNSRQEQFHFGGVYKKRYDSVSSSVDQYFSLVSEKRNEVDLYTMTPKMEPDAELLKIASGFDRASFAPFISKALRAPQKKANRERLQYVIDGLNKGSDFSRKVFCSGVDFIDGNVSVPDMKRMDKMLRTHRIGHLFISCSSLSEQFNMYKIISSEASKRGEWVFGYLEAKRRTVKADNILDVVKFGELLDVIEKNASMEITQRLIPSQLIYGYRVVEYITGKELLDEGHRVHHCVGGYADAIRDGRSRIISIRKGEHVNQSVTLEIGPVYSSDKQAFLYRRIFEIKQCRGLQNRNASESELMIAEIVCAEATIRSVFHAKLANILCLNNRVKLSVFSALKWISKNGLKRKKSFSSFESDIAF